MEQINPQKKSTTITEIVSGIKVVESEFEVQVPLFVEVKIDKPVFVEKQVEVPVGYDKVINASALELSEKIISFVMAKLDDKLSKAIDSRLTEITYPKLVEKLQVTEIPVTIEKPIYKDVEVSRP